MPSQRALRVLVALLLIGGVLLFLANLALALAWR